MNIAYECKFCNRPGIVILEEYEGIEFQLEKWKPVLCCNRCGDFMVSKRAVIDKVQKTSSVLTVARHTTKGPAQLKAESACRETLTRLTKELASIACDYYNKTNVWEQEFVDMLMDNPHKFWKICNQYVRSIKTI